jgi:chemotaxis protein CheX
MERRRGAFCTSQASATAWSQAYVDGVDDWGMHADIAQPFLMAARGVLEQELGGEVGRGRVKVERGDFTAGEVTAVVGVTGALSGAILYRMSEVTALAIVGQMMGQRFTELDALARSGVGELGNVITGRAGVLLERAGVRADIAPPVLLIGRGGLMSSLDIARLVVPLETRVGSIDMQIALKKA